MITVLFSDSKCGQGRIYSLVQNKMWGPYYMKPPPPPPPDCLHPTHTVVVINILLMTRAAMHTTIAAAAVWQFEATQNRFLYSLITISIFPACYHVAKNGKKNCAFVGGPVRPNMLNMRKSASECGYTFHIMMKNI